MKPIDALSTEPILLGPVSHRVAGVETNPTSYTVEAALVPAGGTPSVWTAAAWETVPSTTGANSWWVRLSVGPLSTLGALTPGDHRALVRILVSGTERPVLDAGTITVV